VLQPQVSKSMIASILNITPETFSRALSRLEHQEIIRVDRRSIHIPDLDRLRARRAC
jgi:CRP-like cAMP-binding protein